jgi:2-dehydro-3-deoxyphosphogluconate aldolase / (4S)-4-hydroxy-2-oxoglutarate aldolase
MAIDLYELLEQQRLLAIVRGKDAAAALATVLALAEEGVGLIEVSMTTPDAMGVLSRARQSLGADFPLGAGTVVTDVDARQAHEAGASFAVTPASGVGVTAAQHLGLPVVAGALTPSEVAAVVADGATAVKLFPAHVLGGPSYLRMLREPFPEVPFVPVGGVDATTAVEYLAAGALAVGAGSQLVGDAADGGDLDALRERARRFRAAVERADPD